MITQKQINSNDLPLRRKHIRLEILDYEFRTIDTIEEECIGGSLQRTSDDSTHTIKRSGNVQIAIPTFSETETFLDKLSGYEIQLGGKIWIDRYIKIYIGIEDYLQIGNPIVWNSFGICLIDNPVRSFSASRYEISFNVIDLMAKLTGERQGQLTGMLTMIEAGVYDYSVIPSIYIPTRTDESLMSVIRELGNFQKVSIAPIPESWEFLPYDIKVTVGATVWDIISQYMDILSTWHIYFDDNGVVIVEPIPNGKNDIVFPLNEEYIVSSDLTTDFNNVKNQVVVYGRLNTLNYFANFTSYDGNTLSLYFDALDESTFTINGTNFGFKSPNEYNANDLTEVKMYVNNVLTYTNTLVGFENTTSSIGANTLEPNEIYFIRIYESDLENFSDLISTPFAPFDMIYGVVGDSNNVYCGTTSDCKFAIYNKTTGTFGGLITNPFGTSGIFGLATDETNVYCAGGDVLGGSGEFAIYSKTSGAFGSLITHPFGTSNLDCLTVDNDNVYVGGASGKFAIYNKASGAFGSLIATPFGTSRISSVAVDGINVYCATEGGKFAIYDKIAGAFGSLITNPFGINDIFSVAIDKENVYCAGGSGKFAIYNKSSSAFGSLITTPIPPNDIYSIYGDDINVYCAGRGGRFAVYNKATGAFGGLIVSPWASNSIFSIYSDLENVYFGGTANKFYIYNKFGYVNMSTSIFEFMGKQQVSGTLVDENLESPFYINAGLKQPNYYCGLAYGLGNNYRLTLNNTEELTYFANGTLITFMANQTNLSNVTVTIIDGVSGATLVSNKLIKKNFWNGGTRDNVEAGIMSNNYTILSLQYDSSNQWFVYQGRHKLVYTKVCSGGEYDNIYSDNLAYERCQWELYLHTNLNNTINISIIPNYILGVDMKIPYNPKWGMPNGFDSYTLLATNLGELLVTSDGYYLEIDNNEIKNYFVKTINYPLGISNTPQTINAIEIYDSGNLVGE